MIPIGIDGCKYGWVTASTDTSEVRLFKNIADVINRYGNDCIFFIDMPMGLPGSSATPRTCEQLARNILAGKRKSSVFNVPCRKAVYASTYEKGNQINKKIIGKGISKQSWNIVPKIKELDRLLQLQPKLRSGVKESHPELCFHGLNQGVSMQHNKKTAEGISERLKLLKKYDKRSLLLFENAMREFKRKDVAPDDIIDAICLSVTGRCIIHNHASHTLPATIIADETGIEMAIHYYLPR